MKASHGVFLGALSAAVVASGAYVAAHHGQPVRSLVQAAFGRVHVVALHGPKVSGHPGYVKVQTHLANGQVPGVPKGHNVLTALPPVYPPWTGALPTISYGPSQIEAPGFKVTLLPLDEVPSTFLNGLDAENTALIAEEATVAIYEDNLPLLASLTNHGTSYTVEGLAHVIEGNAQQNAIGQVKIYSLRITGISLNTADTEDTGAAGGLPVWDVNYQAVISQAKANEWSGPTNGKVLTVGTLTVATAITPHGGALNAIVNNTNSDQPLPSS